MKTLRQLLTNGFAWIFAIAHWLIFAIGVYQRGGLSADFHLYYEPVLLQILLLLDFAWLLLGELVIGGSLENPSPTLIFTGTAAGIQWFLIGHGISRLREKSSKKSNPPVIKTFRARKSPVRSPLRTRLSQNGRGKTPKATLDSLKDVATAVPIAFGEKTKLFLMF